jgi:hypothetical protein
MDADECPPPVITSLATYVAGWMWWPRAVETLAVKATGLGYEVRIGFARGYKPGRSKDTWELLDTIGVWLHKPGRPVAGFVWERSPDGADGWKAGKASFRGANGRMVVGHMAGKAML